MPPTMICLAGEQPLANAIPARQIGAERLVVLHTDDEARSVRPARALRDWWGPARAELRSLGDGFDYAAALRRVENLARELSGEVVANVTGGTKPMSFALLSVASARGWRVVYLDTQHGRLWWLPGGTSESLAAGFGLDELLGLHGCTLSEEVELTDAIVATAEVIARHRTACQQLLEAVSAHVGGHPWRPPLLKPGLWEALRDAGGLVGTARAYEMTEDGWAVLRHNGWLEALAADGLRRAGAREVVLSAQRREVGDEYDAMATLGPRLVLVECKAGARVDEDAIKSLRQDAFRLGGLLALPLLVWCPPAAASRERCAVARERARDHGVLLIESWDPDRIAAAVRRAVAIREPSCPTA